MLGLSLLSVHVQLNDLMTKYNMKDSNGTVELYTKFKLYVMIINIGIKR